MKSHQLIKHSLNRTEKIPVDHPVLVPLDCSMHMQIGPLLLCLYCIENKKKFMWFALGSVYIKKKKRFGIKGT